MATGGGSTDPEKREAYYLRLHVLIIQEGTAVLKALFNHHVPPIQLHAFLQDKKVSKTIRMHKDKNPAVKAQYHHLYPPYCPPNSDNFDISLLVFLLQNVRGLDKRSKWWNVKDNNNIPDTEVNQEADIVRIRNMRNLMQHKNVASLEEEEFESMWDNLEKTLVRLAASSNISAQNIQQKIDDVKTRKLDLVSAGMRSLRSNTELFLQEYSNSSQFVETKTFGKAKELLKEKQIVILTGHPGEGKTTMAARLALSMSQLHNCLKLSEPSDWREIDLSLKLFDTVIIDDIFGSGTLEQWLVGKWKQLFNEIETAAKQKAVRFIITSRHYIFEESKEELGALPLFKTENKNSVLLTSSDLSEEDRIKILEIQAKKNDKEIPDTVIQECIKVSKGPSEDTDFLFGFPECASMFVRNDELRRSGADFFKKPATFFKGYLQDLYRGGHEGKFMALVAVWAKENKKLCKDELRKVTTVSDHVKRIVEEFGFSLSYKYLKMLGVSLASHVGGFLVYNETTEEYAFSHNVIADMVGLVAGQEMPEETIKVCPRDFLMEYVSTDVADMNEFKVILKDRKIHCLVEKCTEMLLRRNCNRIAEETDIGEFQMLRRQGRRSNDIQIINKIDFGIIKHPAFKSPKFVKEFVDHVEKRNIVKEVFCVPVMTMTGYFLDYGISMKKLDMCLMGYAWFSGTTIFAKEVITRGIVEMTSHDRTVSLLLATHSGQKDSVQYLLEHGADVTGDVIYIAVHKSDELLEMLLKHSNINVNDKGNAINGNHPLIVATRKNLSKAVEVLLKFGADASVQNNAKMTALHKAILYKRTDIINALIKAGAPLNVKGGKFKRTPLHLAADLGKAKYVQDLLEKGSNVRDVLKIKDHRGQYPLHIAAIQGHVRIVRLLLEFDKTQETLRISSFGTKSLIKGMSIFHIAVWKKNIKLLKALIGLDINPNIQDFFGQTPLFFAIMKDQEKYVKKLLSYSKTDKRIPQKQGFTPLHAAIHRNLTKVAKLLIKDSDVNSTDKYGRAALHVACEKANIPIIKDLLRNEANPRMLTKRDDTVYHILKRRSIRARITAINNLKIAESILAEFDPEFVMQLPNLRNKSGVKINLSYRPSGISRERLLMQSPNDEIQRSDGDSSRNSSNDSDGEGDDDDADSDSAADIDDNEDDDDQIYDDYNDDNGDDDDDDYDDEIIVYFDYGSFHDDDNDDSMDFDSDEIEDDSDEYV